MEGEVVEVVLHVDEGDMVVVVTIEAVMIEEAMIAATLQEVVTGEATEADPEGTHPTDEMVDYKPKMRCTNS